MKRLLVVTLLLIGAGLFLVNVSVERQEPMPPPRVVEPRPIEIHVPASPRAASRVHFAHGPQSRDGRVLTVVAEADEDPADDHEDISAFAGDTPQGNSAGVHVFAGDAHATIDATGVHVSVGTPPNPPAVPEVPAIPPERAVPRNATITPQRVEIVELASDWKVDPEQARDDLSKKFEGRLSDWLSSAGVPAVWHPSADLVHTLIRSEPVVDETEQRDYAQLYRAHMKVDLSPERKHELVSAYRRHLAGVWLGGGLLFTLASLGIIGGYIRADEATRGYYTNRLRLASAAGLGGAAVLLVQWILRAS